jgi:hypothetical protein
MEVVSPVGSFPLRLRSARIRDGKVRVNADMGAWRSEVGLGREDLPLVAACAAVLAVVFLLGRASKGG